MIKGKTLGYEFGGGARILRAEQNINTRKMGLNN